jgi:parallel beta-helix repeat protein
LPYLQTSAESAAGVTPTDVSYPPGHILRYGENTTPGTTDMSTALDNAIKSNECVDIGSDILLISATITITNDGVKIKGSGASSIVRANAATFNLFTVEADDVVFEGVNFQGAASDDTTVQYGIFTASASPANRGVVKNCLFGGSGASARLNDGIKIDASCDDWLVSENHFEEMLGNISGTGYGVLTGAVNHARIVDNRFIATAANGRHAVYLSTGATFCEVIGNICEDYPHQHIAINAQSTQAASSYNLIANNICDGGQTNSTTGQIAIFGLATGNTIIGNTCINSGENAILINNRFSDAVDNASVDTQIKDNTIIDCGTIGIDIWGTTRTVIEGNTIQGASKDSNGTSPAIRLRASNAAGQACTDASVISNVVTGSDHRAAFQLNATSPTPTGASVRGNVFAAGVSFTIEANSIGYDGPAYGEIYVQDNASTVTLNSAAKVQVTDFDSNGQSNNLTPDHTNDHITVLYDGIYMCMVSVSVDNDASQAHKIELSVYKNNGATEFPNVHAHRNLSGGSGDQGSITMSGLISLTAGDTIELWADTDSASDRAVTFSDVTLTLTGVNQ